MRKHIIIRLFFAIALIFVFSSSARATVISFDDVTDELNMGLNTNYEGFLWGNTAVLNTDLYHPDDDNGFRNGTVSPDYVAYNQSSWMSLTSPDLFTFNGAYLTGAWRNGLNIRADAYRNGTLLYSSTVTVNAFSPEWYTFNFKDIDRLFLSSYGGVAAGYFASGINFAVDDFTYNEHIPNPEPSTFILLGAGVAGLAFWRRRRKLRG